MHHETSYFWVPVVPSETTQNKCSPFSTHSPSNIERTLLSSICFLHWAKYFTSRNHSFSDSVPVCFIIPVTNSRYAPVCHCQSYKVVPRAKHNRKYVV